jgi:translation initiation factor IF-3
VVYGGPKDLRINRRIRAREMRLIGHEGKQLGITPLHDALRIANELGLDLVEVSPDAKPPVCKIMDYGKYRYQMNKKQSKHKTAALKEVKFRPQISKHDMDFKIKNIKRFLDDGSKVKVTLMFRGREIVHSSLARKVFEKIVEGLSDNVNVDQMPRMEGRLMVMILSPKSQDSKVKVKS